MIKLIFLMAIKFIGFNISSWCKDCLIIEDGSITLIDSEDYL
jgi:hypothetical protein